MAIRDENGYKKTSTSIGTWNMDTGTTVFFAHGLSSTEYLTMRSITGIIYADNGTDVYPLDTMLSSTGVFSAGIGVINATNISLYRFTTGDFDAAGFATTPTVGGVTTRGYVTFEYIAD